MASASRAPLWLRHAASLRHEIPGHPERPERLLALEATLADRDWLGWRVAEAPAVQREQLRAVHPEEHIASIEDLCASGGGMIDMDTAAVPETWEAIVRGAGAAVAVVDAVLGGDAPAAFAGVRPPGHHATRSRAMGFCFFNNVAVAARHATVSHGLSRVLVLDWDVHHGNGTNDIFHADDDVLFVSLHQSPLYPGTGEARDEGSGAGTGYTVNLPVPPGTGDDGYRSLVEHVACPLIEAWEPELVLLSAGFDAHHADPLADCRVTEAGFAGMTASLRRACEAAGAPLGGTLEGGYSLEALTGSMVAVLPVLGGSGGVDEGGPVEVHPLAGEAAKRLEPTWPSVAATVAAASR